MQNLGTTHILVGELAKDYSKLSTEEKNKLAKTLFGIVDNATPKPTVPTNGLSTTLSSITEVASGDGVASASPKPVTVDTTSINTVPNAATSNSNVTPTNHDVSSVSSTVNVVPTTESSVVPTQPTRVSSEPSSVTVVETKEITISAVKVSTFYSDKAMKLATELTANVVDVNKENGTVKLKNIGRVVPANTGVIITGEPGTYTLTSTTEAAQEFGKNDLKGTVTDIPASEVAASSDIYYALAVNKGTPCFGIVETDIPAGKAYFTVPKSDSTDNRFPNGFTISTQD